MARKILFRGKGCGSGEWFYGDLIHRRFLGKDVVIIRSEDNGFDNYVDYKVIPETVGQYTGITDKHGKKVFDGDIIRYADRLAFNCYSESIEVPEEYDGCYYEDIFTTDEVVYGIYYDYPAFDLKNHDFDCNGLSELCNGDWYFEVIGNIHEQGVQ